MEIPNLCLPSIPQPTALDSNKSVSTNQVQLNSVYAHSDEVFNSMNKLRRDSLTWQELQINQDAIAHMLHQNSPQRLHEKEIMTITGEELDCLCIELECQSVALIPSPFLMAQEVYDALEVHKSVVQSIIGDMMLLELMFPDEEDLKGRRSEHEADARDIDGYLDNMLMTVRAISVRPS